MQQTLLALAAILAFSYFALSRHRADNDVERRAIGIEAELAAADVARARMAELERLAFDEDDVDRTGVRQTPPTSGIGPDLGENAEIAYDDVDDWDGYTTTVALPAGTDSLRFNLAIAVRYVQPDAPATPSLTPTLAKEVLVRIDELPNGPLDRAPAQTALRRVVTPASVATYIQ